MKRMSALAIVCSLTSCSSCGKEKFKVPREPETAKRILLTQGEEGIEAMLKEFEAKNDKRYVGIDTIPVDQVALIGWDIIKPDGMVDYVTARQYEFKDVDGVNQLVFPDYSRVYFVDFLGNADGDINKMYMFEDQDEDGDTNDKEFVLVREPLE